MIKQKINVPNQINYLSDWEEMDGILPPGKIIVNKVICGCGMTDYYLTNDMPVILVSPRRELINSKLNDDRIKDRFYFDRSNKRVSIEESKTQLINYLWGNSFNQPAPSHVPKIFTTYDSLGLVIDTLRENHMLDDFIIVGDEMTCIFTDARMKGAKSMDILNIIDCLPNRCVFITATPLKEDYLDLVPVFNQMTYVELVWDPHRKRDVCIHKAKMKSTKSQICNIIDSFRANGFFQSKNVAGQQVYSREAVFFVNSLRDIIAIVKDKGLTTGDTRIICADDFDNRTQLKRIGFEKPDHFPSRKNYRHENKTFTFATRCSFEGADLYSDTVSTYIFADSNRENLALDISIDLPQIIGRCRTLTNPFRNDIYYFYKTSDIEEFDQTKALLSVQNKIRSTESLLSQFPASTSQQILEKMEAAQQAQKYQKDYFDVIRNDVGDYVPVFNNLVMIADKRAIEIKHEQYATKFSILEYLEANGYNATDYVASIASSIYGGFYQAFIDADSFEDRMKLFCESCDWEPSIFNWADKMSDIPKCYCEYYRSVGSEKCRSLSYKEASIKDYMIQRNCSSTVAETLAKMITIGESYTNEELKEWFGAIYNTIGLRKTPKATDISEYYNVKPTKVQRNGRRFNGYKII